MTEVLFSAAIDARYRGCLDIAERIGDLLISWAFKGGRHRTGWRTFDLAICGSATLALLQDGGGAKLKKEIKRRLEQGELPDQEMRGTATQQIRDRADSLGNQGHLFSAIEQRMANADPKQLDPLLLDPLLREIADLILPETSEDDIQPVVPG